MLRFFVEKGAFAPTKREEDAGWDFRVKSYSPEYVEELLQLNGDNITITDKIFLKPGKDIKIPSGVRSSFEKDQVLIAFNKSGIATKKKLCHGACVIDFAYQGNIIMHLINTSDETQEIEFESKILQFVLLPIINENAFISIDLNTTVEEFYKGHTTVRGEKGFGSQN
jgi:dUTPase